MSTGALLMMIITMGIVIAFTGYFFFRILKTPPKPEPDSYSDNDPKK